METILDAYEVAGRPKYEELFRDLYNNFYNKHDNKKGNWMSNEYNGDIMWITIACVRAHLLFGDQKFLDIAIEHFDKTYERAFVDEVGLLRWKENGDDSVNSCVNGPAEVAACYIAIATGHEGRYLYNIKDSGYAGYMNINFADRQVNAINISMSDVKAGEKIEIHRDKLNGEIIGALEIDQNVTDKTEYTIEINTLTGLNNVFISFINGEDIGNIYNIGFAGIIYSKKHK